MRKLLLPVVLVCAAGFLCLAADLSPAQRLRQALPTFPEKGAALMQIAVLEARAGNTAGALAALEEVVALRQGYSPEDQPEFAALANEPRFKALVERVRRELPAVMRSKVAFELPARDLVPEGIAAGPDGTLYVGSIAKRSILRRTPDGKIATFVPEGAGGLWAVLGMKVDPDGKSLWVASQAESGPETGSAGIFRFDLASGNLLGKWTRSASEGGRHLYNDLVVTKSGDVLFTDSTAGAVNRLDVKTGAITPVTKLPLVYANGIALAPDGRTLFVADWRSGITRIDVATGAGAVLPHPADVTLGGVDGLLFHDDALIAVQNGLGLPRVTRFALTPQLDRVTGAEVLAYRDPNLRLPTTAALHGETLYVVGDALLDRWNAKTMTDGTPLPPSPITAIPLRRAGPRG